MAEVYVETCFIQCKLKTVVIFLTYNMTKVIKHTNLGVWSLMKQEWHITSEVSVGSLFLFRNNDNFYFTQHYNIIWYTKLLNYLCYLCYLTSNCPRSTPNCWVIFGICQSEQKHKNKPYHDMRSNHRHKIRFQDIVCLKFNKWMAKILQNINRKNSTWCV